MPPRKKSKRWKNPVRCFVAWVQSHHGKPHKTTYDQEDATHGTYDDADNAHTTYNDQKEN